VYNGLLYAHETLAYLLVLSTTVSLALALTNAVLGSRPRLARLGSTLARKVEVSLGGLLMLLGVILWVAGHFSILTWWLWAGVIFVAGQGMIVGRGIKPQVTALQEGDASRRWLWLAWAALHWVWIGAILGFMQAH